MACKNDKTNIHPIKSQSHLNKTHKKVETLNDVSLLISK